jgi:TolA-binding protein/TM2 domain-containing membrane protein YozV
MNRIFSLSLSLILILSVLSFEARAGGAKIDSKKQFDFAERLFEESDYFRAITEYKRFIFLYPDNRLCEKCSFRICESYYGARRWENTIAALEQFITQYHRSSMLNDAFYLKGMAEKNLKSYDDALSSFQHIIDSGQALLRDKAYFQSALIFVDLENWRRAREYFSNISQESTLYPSAWIFSTGLENVEGVPRKSPALAGTLAAIIPGAGHLYTERPRDALVAFLLNSAFIWAAVELFEDDKYVAGGIVTFFELGWYTGNIYSAVGSAHKYNRRAKNNFIQNLKDRTNVSYYFDNETSHHYLTFSLSY